MRCGSTPPQVAFPKKRYDVGIGDGRLEPRIDESDKPRRLDLVAVVAQDEQNAIAKLMSEGRTRYGDEPPRALVGISHAY
jgi:hypothetical protein